MSEEEIDSKAFWGLTQIILGSIFVGISLESFAAFLGSFLLANGIMSGCNYYKLQLLRYMIASNSDLSEKITR